MLINSSRLTFICWVYYVHTHEHLICHVSHVQVFGKESAEPTKAQTPGHDAGDIRCPACLTTMHNNYLFLSASCNHNTAENTLCKNLESRPIKERRQQNLSLSISMSNAHGIPLTDDIGLCCYCFKHWFRGQGRLLNSNKGWSEKQWKGRMRKSFSLLFS